MKKKKKTTPAQEGLGDMGHGEFRREAGRVADRVADYLERLETFPVLPDVRPGEIGAGLPPTAPASPEPFEEILADYARLIEPNVTHWQHPGFMAYFPSVASGPGILGEWLASGLNSNVMFWKNAPAATELEQCVVSWLRQMLGLPQTFDGMFTDTASVSSLLSLTAARHAVDGLESREKGLTGRELPRLRLYVSAEGHFSIDKAAIVIGVGLEGVRRIDVDSAYRMRPEVLARAIAEDRANGWLPFCVVGTLGSTSCTSVDPAGAIADVCADEGLWFHIDAAYGGAAALVPEMRPIFAGWERADSIVFNPHKWLFTPFDASLLLFRRPEVFREAFSIVPEVIRASEIEGVRNYSEYGVQLGRRFRALKLWMLIRYFGVEGIAARIREHCRLARAFASWIDAEPDWELLAPTTMALVCFRFHPAGATKAELDTINAAILDKINASGKFYLSHAGLENRFTIRLVVGNPRTEERHVTACWSALRRAANEAKL